MAQIPKSPITEPEPIPGRIAWHIENTLVRFGRRIFNALADSVKTMFIFVFDGFLELIEPGIINQTRPILDEIKNTDGMSPSVIDVINRVQSGEYQSGGLITLLLTAAGFMGLMSGPAQITARRLSQETDTRWRTNLPDPSALWGMVRRGIISPEVFEWSMQRTGWSDDFISAWGALTQSLLTNSEWGNAFLRGIVSDGEFSDELRKRGYNETSINLVKQLLQIIPGPSDLIRMAVREAWNDEVSRTFGYDQDFPPEFGEWSEKIGLSSDWAKRFWRAHWELPGVREGFEMLHRRFISKGELELLLRSRDIPSFWRERLVKLSYEPYTRVDVRRMYDLGVVSETEVYENYQDLGYDEEHALKLTEWTIKEYGEGERELTKSEVLSAYKDGVITQNNAIIYLASLDYSEEQILILISRIDLQKEADYEREVVENVRLAFVSGLIDENDVIAELGALNPPSGFIEERLKLWRIQAKRGLKNLTIAQVKSFWSNGVIDENETETELKKIGYTKKYIDWFFTLWESEVM